MNGGRLWGRIGAVLGGLSVAAGAFGAHSLKDKLNPGQLQNFETAARYQMYHALAILAVGIFFRLSKSPKNRSLSVAGWAFLWGTILFSGSLYGHSLGGPRWLVFLTPVGGLFFLIGWIGLLIAMPRED